MSFEFKLHWSIDEVDFSSEAFAKGLHDRKLLFNNPPADIAGKELASYREGFVFGYTRRPEKKPKTYVSEQHQ